MGTFGVPGFPGFGFPGFPGGGFNPMAPLEQAGRGLLREGAEAVTGAASRAMHRVTDPITGAVENAGNAVGHWLGHGADTGDAATAQGGTPLHQDAPLSLWGSIGQGIGDFGRGLQQEGLSGLLDSGMMDRQQAQRDLSNRFQVVGSDFTGERASNQVSQEEYQQIARTFSNVRRGEGDLSIDDSQFSGDADADRGAWNAGIQANVADMMMTTSGRRQVNTLSNNVARKDDGSARTYLPFGLGPEVHHQTTIQPLFGEQVVNPTTGRTEWQTPPEERRTGTTLRTDNAFAAAQGTDAETFRSPTGVRGVGSDSKLSINPGMVAGLRSDVVMAHEIQHAFNHTQGNRAQGKFGGTGPDATINNRERQAVGLTRSDTGGLAAGHFPGDEDGCTENQYREERNELGMGDRFLPRTQYSGTMPGEAPSTMTDEQLQALWDAHNTGPNVIRPAAPPPP